MRLRHSFTISEPPDRVMELFLDAERVAGCMPGSRLTGKVGEDTYEGEVRVKVGPLAVGYRGSVRFLDVDNTERQLRIKASGTEQNGAGNAEAHVLVKIEPDGGGTTVSLDTDLVIRGKVAQFGRGVMGDVSQRLMDEFAHNVEALMSGAEPALPGGPTDARTALPAHGPADPQPSASLDGFRLVILPALRRAGPAAAAFAAGVAAGAVLARRRPRR